MRGPPTEAAARLSTEATLSALTGNPGTANGADADGAKAPGETIRLLPAGTLTRYRGLLWPAVMVLGILVVYVPGAVLTDSRVLFGSDHYTLHVRRLAYAREHLFSSEPRLPGWYTREMLGTPFWSNIQNFPFTPPRLVLLAFEPHAAYAVGVGLAAVLTGLFTYLYGRRIGLGNLAAAAAGWTAACCGFFASRVMAGHLPLLEAFPALPLLLWLVEVCRGRGRDDSALPHEPDAPGAATAPSRRAVLALGAGAACVALAGHPQLPVYALAAAFLYAIFREPRQWRIPTAMVLGAGMAAFALLPMLSLVGRSTRVLRLDAPNNDFVLPYWRVGALASPWKDGWPEMVKRGVPNQPFLTPSRDDDGLFWDTVSYVGWLPLLAAGGLLAWWAAGLLRRKSNSKTFFPTRPWLFIVAMGVLPLLMALPPVHALTSRLPGVFLRSPSRLLYLTSFALALGLGAALEAMLRSGKAAGAGSSPRAGSARAGSRGKLAYVTCAAVAVALVAHAADLGSHARSFVTTTPLPPPFLGGPPAPPSGDGRGTPPGDGPRAAMDCGLCLPENRRVDDVGFFDSIMLARTYRALLAMAEAPRGFNTQMLNGSQLKAQALELLGAELVLTTRARRDLVPLTGPVNGLHIYGIADPAPRAAFFPLRSVRVLDRDAMEERFRRMGREAAAAEGPRFSMAVTPDAPGASALPAAGASVAPGTSGATGAAAPAPSPSPAPLLFRRLSSDTIVVDVNAPEAGYVRVIEAWDEGWSATVDGEPADVAPADDTFLAVQVPPGPHEVVLDYRTKHARTGVLVSLLSLILLGLVARTARTFRGIPGR